MKKSVLMLACLGAAAWLWGNRKKKKELLDVAEPETPAPACEEPPVEVAVAEEVPVDEGKVLTVYYTENGKVFHTDPRCVYLKRSANILESTPEGAAFAGKTRPCSGCAMYMEA